MNIKNNKRSKASVSAIKEAVLTLIDQGHDINNVSIKTICELAGVNRSTFYAHYSIPGEVLKEIEDDALSVSEEYLSKIESNEISHIELLLGFIKDNDHVFRVLLLKAKDERFTRAFLGQSFSRFSLAHGWIRNKDLIPYMDAMIFEGSKGIINAWIEGNYKMSEKDLAAFLVKTITQIIKSAD